jgi:hypothetical protein
VHDDARVLVVIETGTAQVAVVHPEAQRLDEVQVGCRVRRQPDHVAGVGRYLGMDEDDGEHGGVLIAPSR